MSWGSIHVNLLSYHLDLCATGIVLSRKKVLNKPTLFQAWALYRGRSDEGPKTLSQMKSNFRTILRKCVVIEEVQRAHQLGLQTGNYKVYRVLSEAEAQSKFRL